ncbi:MAG TPA: AmmeMemoRadiSam system protein B [Sedimentisphaerales bacterium]|jgi:AmmeMemoRadiSam system protein B/AmmeMemoRadiSam system protein A|nr:AmmeMemoRadiSam system protein B [Sedimentisphaerales bacterium]HNU28279.1 AmmeMemoRadiSam system protein B [Sedimentisphaerales bacterium]
MNARLRKTGAPILLACCLIVAAAGIGRHAVNRSPVTPLAAADTKVVLKSSIAGSWYSSDANELRSQIAGYMAKAQVEPKQDIIALVLPHAGYAYSGPTAAYGIKSLGRNYRRVVVIGPTHRLPMEDMLSVPHATHCETPLGQIPLDVELIGKLLEYPLFQSVPAAHQQEHSVEIEIPLLQSKLTDFQLVPIVAGQCSYEAVAEAGKILASLIDADTLVVASSDFTHYGPQYQYVPFKENIPQNIKKLDMGAFDFIGRLDARGLLNYRNQAHATICGCVPVAVLLEMLGKDTKVELLRYTTSGEALGDYTNSVSYLAVAFHGVWTVVPAPPTQAQQSPLTAEDKKLLLNLARRTIRYALDNRKVPEPSDLDFTPTESMKPPRGAFVTLKKNGQLRGCIGDIFPQRPLYKAVIGNAIYAAFGDRRFEQLQSNEYDQIKIEISALTPPTSVASAQDIRIGIDGMVLKKNGRSAVFLPQVASEQGWDLATTLQHLSVKAGLPADAWKQGATFQVFQADVFGEEP